MKGKNIIKKMPKAKGILNRTTYHFQYKTLFGFNHNASDLTKVLYIKKINAD